MNDWHDPQRFAAAPAYRGEPVGANQPTMLHGSELRLLKWFTRTQYRGAGAVVELGCWLGGSTGVLVEGLRANPRAEVRAQRVQTYDAFLWHEIYDRYNLGLTHRPGESFQADFERHVKPWRDRVDVHGGNVTSAHWPGGSIEILFVDVMKDMATARAVALTFFPHLVPDRSYLIHQDFKNHFEFWIHLMMYRLREHFVPVLNVADGATLVYQPVAIPARADLESACDFNHVGEDEVDAAFDHSETIIAGSTPALHDQVVIARARAKAVLFPAPQMTPA